MSVNKYRPHVYVLPEDEANRDIANGFVQALDDHVLHSIQILNEAGGWISVREKFCRDHVYDMEKYPNRFIVLLIDLDHQEDRVGQLRSHIPGNLKDRVFILGSLGEPEDLRPQLGSYETIGRQMAQGCRNRTNQIWDHELLQHNRDELGRLSETVRAILFR